MIARSWFGKESGAVKLKNSDLSQKTLEVFRKTLEIFRKTLEIFRKTLEIFQKTLEIFQHLEIVSRFLLENLAALLEILATCPITTRGPLLASLALLEIVSARLARFWSMQERGFLDTQ